MCDTSLTHTANGSATVVRRAAQNRPRPVPAGLTCGNEETAKVIHSGGPETGTHPQFGPVVDLAYTRCRATW
ncbi:hypothetical protein HGI09_33450 [Streptomyces collinus]|nr:hypothetical protein HGI10_30670 [Streptomyces collinus]UJA16006.1 hypothetical protein HGI09_33450 [Streptomyces collinus]